MTDIRHLALRLGIATVRFSFAGLMTFRYLRFDEIENEVIIAWPARSAGELNEQADSAPHWKWIIVGAHDPVQRAIVCAIADSTGTNV